jgi:hypothetical protein
MTTWTWTRFVCLGSLVAAGCGTSGSDEDAAAALAGTWQRFDDDGTLRDEFTFGADFSYAFDERDGGDDDHLLGTFTIVDGIIVTEGDGFTQRMSFAIDGDRLSPGAGVRIDGDSGELPGTYRSELLLWADGSAFGGIAENELRDDGTAQHREESADGKTSSYDGTWAYDTAADKYEMRLEVGSSEVRLLFEFRADAIGEFAWVKQP